MSTTDAVSRDQALYSKKKPGDLEFLQYAAKQSGRGLMSLIMEWRKLNRGRGKLPLSEYVGYRVYDPELSDEARGRFISNLLHWPITHICCDMTWQAATEDKWLCYHTLKDSPVRVPETLAVFDRTGRAYPGTRKLSGAADFKDFLAANGDKPVFCKENRGIASFGAFSILGTDGDRVNISGEGWMDFDSFVGDFIGDKAYLLQSVETNHGFFGQFTANLATVRLCILAREDGIHVPFAVLKLPTDDNVADSFWRSGNMACALDPATGEILKARTRQPFGTDDHTVYPGKDVALIGQTLPHWQEVLTLAENCSAVFAPLRYQSMDIAITDDGPVLIEINTGGGFDLPQFATGQGFLTDDVCDFFRQCGYQKL
ncbi:sugar-transfer associated ATP-grasp domain-containing protein [Kordiimonas marina]|uniref:sugar-transfer associated ATP-grasp domain-containing protein n=1 Tax=Kordiimonas marina TaxID=2872312 RepID=UPI001FF19801|nr:sugar-transfer associated ATP-grasp domain-containing protein [Kordiimonas marina]MCJ9428381.1 hypothetical protein [Kordiimonas marina]